MCVFLSATALWAMFLWTVLPTETSSISTFTSAFRHRDLIILVWSVLNKRWVALCRQMHFIWSSAYSLFCCHCSCSVWTNWLEYEIILVFLHWWIVFCYLLFHPILRVCNSCLEISSYFICAAAVPLLTWRSSHVNVLAWGVCQVWLGLTTLGSSTVLCHSCQPLLCSLTLGDERFYAENCIASLVLRGPDTFDSWCWLLSAWERGLGRVG